VTVSRGVDCVTLALPTQDRAEGYVTELPYTLGYYPELDPRRVRETLAAAGVAIAPIRRACELGFGRGLSLAIHAVAGDAEWWGNDLLPRHVEELETLTRGLTNRIHVSAETFAEFCEHTDFPEFDFIALHGVWSWISAENRSCIGDFIDRRLAPRGVLYLSYNLREAWAAVLPLRRFLVDYAARPDLARWPLAERIEVSLVAAQRAVALDLPPARDDPEFERHLRRIRHQRKAYLAHEYFNRDWQAFDHAEIASSLEPLGLQYAGQASENARSHGAPQRFRRDLWVRVSGGAEGLTQPPLAHIPDARATRGDSVRRTAVFELNNRLLNLALVDPYVTTLASPVTGAGVEFDWRSLLALAAWRRGIREANAIAGFTWQHLQRLGHPLVHRDTVIHDATEAVAILQREAAEFLATTLPRLQELGIEQIGGAGR